MRLLDTSSPMEQRVAAQREDRAYAANWRSPSAKCNAEPSCRTISVRPNTLPATTPGSGGRAPTTCASLNEVLRIGP
ncbi:hypothetical protein [Nonomuraea sp. B19D2]|uniref:hypothetical protein n=1 Tax=Nonomuraea sp. B19D2 TaxID=3159561 RepID=UPI0032DBE95D